MRPKIQRGAGSVFGLALILVADHYSDRLGTFVWVVLLASGFVFLWAWGGFDKAWKEAKKLWAEEIAGKGSGTDPDLLIQYAGYGAENLYKDVTIILRGYIKQNKVNILVSNVTLHGDPYPNVQKHVVVKYSYGDGKTRDIIRHENDRLVLPDDEPTSPTSASELRAERRPFVTLTLFVLTGAVIGAIAGAVLWAATRPPTRQIVAHQTLQPTVPTPSPVVTTPNTVVEEHTTSAEVGAKVTRKPDAVTAVVGHPSPAPTINQSGHNNIAQVGNYNTATINPEAPEKNWAITNELCGRLLAPIAKIVTGQPLDISIGAFISDPDGAHVVDELSRCLPNVSGWKVSRAVLPSAPPGVTVATSEENEPVAIGLRDGLRAIGFNAELKIIPKCPDVEVWIGRGALKRQ